MFGSRVAFLPSPKSKDNYVWFARHLLFVQLNVRAKKQYARHECLDEAKTDFYQRQPNKNIVYLTTGTFHAYVDLSRITVTC